MLDNSEINFVMEKLESMDDQELAVKLLFEFNQKTAILGKLLRNLDSSLSHAEWKSQCDEAKREVDAIIAKISHA